MADTFGEDFDIEEYISKLLKEDEERRKRGRTDIESAYGLALSELDKLYGAQIGEVGEAEQAAGFGVSGRLAGKLTGVKGEIGLKKADILLQRAKSLTAVEEGEAGGMGDITSLLNFQQRKEQDEIQNWFDQQRLQNEIIGLGFRQEESDIKKGEREEKAAAKLTAAKRAEMVKLGRNYLGERTSISGAYAAKREFKTPEEKQRWIAIQSLASLQRAGFPADIMQDIATTAYGKEAAPSLTAEAAAAFGVEQARRGMPSKAKEKEAKVPGVEFPKIGIPLTPAGAVSEAVTGLGKITPKQWSVLYQSLGKLFKKLPITELRPIQRNIEKRVAQAEQEKRAAQMKVSHVVAKPTVPKGLTPTFLERAKKRPVTKKKKSPLWKRILTLGLGR